MDADMDMDKYIGTNEVIAVKNIIVDEYMGQK